MQVTCSGCERALNIPDEKLPKDQVFTITCPGCKARVRVDQHLQAPAGRVPKAPAHEEGNGKSPLIIKSEFDDEDELIIYDENDLLALVLDDTHRDEWTRALEERQYKVQYAKSPEHAVHKMKFTHYHFVALHENYGNVSFRESVVYRLLIEMPMGTRRNIFLALLGDSFHTLNNMDAFALSVNLVINEKDLNQLALILKKSIGENDAFYKIFKENERALGLTWT